MRRAFHVAQSAVQGHRPLKLTSAKKEATLTAPKYLAMLRCEECKEEWQKNLAGKEAQARQATL